MYIYMLAIAGKTAGWTKLAEFHGKCRVLQLLFHITVHREQETERKQSYFLIVCTLCRAIYY